QFAVLVFKKQDEQANLGAVTYRVLKSISSSTFIAAVWNSFEFEDFDQDYIISACSHPTSDPTIQHMEIVLDKLVSPATIANTPIQLGDQRFTPILAPPARVNRFVIRNYDFKNNYREDTVQIFGNYFAAMGDVITIEVLVFRMGITGMYVPNHQVVVYTMGDKTPEEAKVERDLYLGSHQSRLVQVGPELHPSAFTASSTTTMYQDVRSDWRCSNMGHIAIQYGKYGKRDVTSNKVSSSSSNSTSLSTQPQTIEDATPNPYQPPTIPSAPDLEESEMSDIEEPSEEEPSQQAAKHSTALSLNNPPTAGRIK
ncbi:hypothetical protein BG011_002431, partial [Mortierella polycephala]